MAKRKIRPRRDGRDGPGGRAKPPRAGGARRSGRGGGGGQMWLYGVHAVLAALANPARLCHRIVVSGPSAENFRERAHGAAAAAGTARPQPETMERRDMEHLLPPGAVHQGIAVLVDGLEAAPLDAAWRPGGGRAEAPVVVLDQVTDPRNVGAVLRSAAAFGAAAVIVQIRHAPDESGALAKAASGALERVPLIRVTNLSRALHELKDAGFWCAGLDAGAEAGIAEASLSGRVALVLGAEGGGLRRLTRETCDLLVRVPMADGMESLNLSNAAAVALYELARDELSRGRAT